MFVAAIVFARIKNSVQRTNEEITFVKAVIIATLNKSSERWSDEDVSALLAIYSEDAIQKLLLQNVVALFNKVSRPGNLPQRKVMPGRRQR